MRQVLLTAICFTIATPALAQRTTPEDLFKRWDRNQDGKLAVGELPENARRNFSKVDTDKDGAISLEEHLKFTNRSRGGQNVTQPPQGVTVLKNVPYAGTNNPRQALDMVIPKRKADGPLPVIAFIHGGGWRNGNKSSGVNRVVPFVRTGRYIGASIGYRLTDEATWPAQIHDCKAAIRWLRGNAKQHGIDPNKIAVWGSSAGGHLVAMLGSSGEVTELEGVLGKHKDQSSRVTAVVNYYGPTALLRMDDFPGRMKHNSPDSPESLLIGAPIQEAKSKSRQASPLTHVTADDAPHLNVHGTKDPLVPFPQGQSYDAALKKAGVESTLITVKDGGHGVPPTINREQVLRFLERHLHATGPALKDETVPARQSN